MRLFLTILVTTILLYGCQRNTTVAPEPTKESIEKANRFIGQGAPQNGGIIIFEGLEPNYTPSILPSLTHFLFEYRTDPLSGMRAIDSFIETEIMSKVKFTFQERADLQLLTYGALEQFVPKLTSSNDDAITGKFLTRLVTHAQPVEFKLMANAFVFASPSMSMSDIKLVANYLKNRTLTTKEADALASDGNTKIPGEKAYAISVVNNIMSQWYDK